MSQEPVQVYDGDGPELRILVEHITEELMKLHPELWDEKARIYLKQRVISHIETLIKLRREQIKKAANIKHIHDQRDEQDEEEVTEIDGDGNIVHKRGLDLEALRGHLQAADGVVEREDGVFVQAEGSMPFSDPARPLDWNSPAVIQAAGAFNDLLDPDSRMPEEADAEDINKFEQEFGDAFEAFVDESVDQTTVNLDKSIDTLGRINKKLDDSSSSGTST